MISGGGESLPEVFEKSVVAAIFSLVTSDMAKMIDEQEGSRVQVAQQKD